MMLRGQHLWHWIHYLTYQLFFIVMLTTIPSMLKWINPSGIFWIYLVGWAAPVVATYFIEYEHQRDSVKKALGK